MIVHRRSAIRSRAMTCFECTTNDTVDGDVT